MKLKNSLKTLIIFLITSFICGSILVISTNNNAAPNISPFDYNEPPLEEIWGEADGEEAFNAISVDSQGNIVVGGSSTSSTLGVSGEDFFLIKYTPDLQQIWNTTIPSEKHDSVQDLVIDSNDNIFVIGEIIRDVSPDVSATNVFLAKFDSNGNNSWSLTWEMPSAYIATSITLDQNEDLIVVGYEPWPEKELFIVKFSAEGLHQWHEHYNVNGIKTEAWDVELDALNNIYIAGTIGYALVGEPRENILLAKFNSTGAILWNSTAGTAASWDIGRGIALHDSTIIVAGDTDIGANWANPVVIKFDENGNQLQNSTWFASGGGHCYDMAQTPGGHIIITGMSANTYAFLTEFDSNLNYLWLSLWGGVSYNLGNAIYADENRAYIAGSSSASGSASGWSDAILLVYETSNPTTTTPVPTTSPITTTPPTDTTVPPTDTIVPPTTTPETSDTSPSFTNVLDLSIWFLLIFVTITFFSIILYRSYRLH
ncbi:MAG: hypothetical protein GF308_09280 [Candidatus Heimdallarchaeota archaeon]|nr:hypothetical protein [Candidatus Heimdallarchaeota archaeon]